MRNPNLLHGIVPLASAHATAPRVFHCALAEGDELTAETTDAVVNWMLGFEKGSPILEELIDLIVRHSRFYRNKEFDNVSMAGDHCTGVIALTQAVWMWMQKTASPPICAGYISSAMESGNCTAWYTENLRTTLPSRT